MNSGPVSLLAQLGISLADLDARGLCVHGEAALLEPAETGADGRVHLLVPQAAAAWRQMKAGALQEGIGIFIVSAFRSVERQAQIIQGKLDAGACIGDIITVCAPPGYSEHHTGRALDLSTPGWPALEAEFDRTPAFEWLTRNAEGYGFRLSYPEGNRWGYQYEPWHWCFGGASAAA